MRVISGIDCEGLSRIRRSSVFSGRWREGVNGKILVYVRFISVFSYLNVSLTF